MLYENRRSDQESEFADADGVWMGARVENLIEGEALEACHQSVHGVSISENERRRGVKKLTH
jgi:hypothetical protein